MKSLRHNAAKGYDSCVFLLGGGDETFYKFMIHLRLVAVRKR